jgi:hypothetical protein
VPKGVVAILGVTNVEFNYALGTDLFGGARAAATFPWLRYCRRCLSHGYHATLFQNFGLRNCPLHDLPLVTECERCRFAFAPKWGATAQGPFACPYCDNLFTKMLPEGCRRHETKLVDLMLTDRRTVLGHEKNTSVIFFGLPRNRWGLGEKVPEARIQRQIHRHLCWPGAPRDESFSFKQERLDVVDMRDDPDWRTMADAVTRAIGMTISKLRTLCAEQVIDVERLATLMDVCESGLRLQLVVGAFAAAFCKTAYLYGVSPVTAGLVPQDQATTHDLATTDRRLVQRGAAFVRSVVANSVLVEYEVLGMFCINLRHVAGLRKLVSVDWRDSPTKTEFCPAWCLERGPNPTLLIRPRGDWALAQKLVKRYERIVLS